MNYRFLTRTFYAYTISAIILFAFNSTSLSQDAASPAPKAETAAVEAENPPVQQESPAEPVQPAETPAQPEATPTEPVAPEVAPAEPAQPEPQENSVPLPEVADLSETEEEKKIATPEIENTPTEPVVKTAQDLDPEANAEPKNAVNSINELWNAVGVAESQWEQFKDGEAWNPAQNNFTAQLIFTAKRFPLDFILPWTKSSQAAADMLDGKDVQDEEKKDIAFELRAFNRTEKRGALYWLGWNDCVAALEELKDYLGV